MKTLTMCTMAAALACAAPAMADDGTPAPSVPSPAQQCKTERAQMGAQTFALTYGTNANRRNAFGKCVSRRSAGTQDAAKTARASAADACRTEQTTDAAAFSAKYGTAKNAFAKCVSATAKARQVETVAAQVTADVNAAKACQAERKADPAAFSTKYGGRRNAFGRCVSTTVKA